MSNNTRAFLDMQLLGELPEHLDDLYCECSGETTQSTQRTSHDSEQCGSFSISREKYDCCIIVAKQKHLGCKKSARPRRTSD